MDSIYGERLQADEPAIRVLTLIPGAESAAIKCLLTRVAFDKAGIYNAVSYTWGDPSDKTSISVNGFHLPIPTNLARFLQHVRSSTDFVVLWADAVCINQEDVEEKSYQVSIMGDIFRHCNSAYIWLGVPQLPVLNDDGAAPTEHAVDPFTLVKHFAQDKHLFELHWFEVDSSTKQFTFHYDKAFSAVWDAFKDAFQKPWWTRFWCIQECLLPSSATVMLGDWKISWRTVKQCEINYKRHIFGCCGTSAGLLPAEYAFYVDAVVANSQIEVSHGPSYHAALSENIDRLLRNFRYKTCQNPRDKIYGILGLLDKSRYPNLVFDYSLSITKVYTNAMEVVLSDGGGDLRCLTGTGFNSEVHELPSWVRNFGLCPGIAAVNAEMTRYELYHLYNACASTKASPMIELGTNIMLDGVWIDNIQKIGRAILHRDWGHIREVLENWIELAKISMPRDRGNDIFTGHCARSFWRTILGDTVIADDTTSRRLAELDMQDYGNWLDDMFEATSSQQVPPMNSWLRSLVSNVHGRAMFRTEKGQIGMCYPESQPGDEVWALVGGRVPFVLRRRSWEPAQLGTFSFIGEGYLDGFMDGEAFESFASQDHKHIVLQ